MRPVLAFVALLAALILWFTWSRGERGAEPAGAQSAAAATVPAQPPALEPSAVSEGRAQEETAPSAQELRHTGRLAGVVRREDGTPVAGVSLFLREHEEWRQVGESAHDGSFALGTLAAGPARLGARAERLSTREPFPVQIVDGATTSVEVTLMAFTEGRLRVNGNVEGPVAVSWIDDRGETRVLEATPGEDLPLGTLFVGRHRFSTEAGRQGALCLAIVRGDEPELEVVLSLD